LAARVGRRRREAAVVASVWERMARRDVTAALLLSDSMGVAKRAGEERGVEMSEGDKKAADWPGQRRRRERVVAIFMVVVGGE